MQLADAVTNVVSWGIAPDAALAAATLHPRAAYGQSIPELSVGSSANFALWSKDMRLTQVVQGGFISPAAH